MRLTPLGGWGARDRSVVIALSWWSRRLGAVSGVLMGAGFPGRARQKLCKWCIKKRENDERLDNEWRTMKVFKWYGGLLNTKRID